MCGNEQRVTARWLVPVAGPVLENGTLVLVDGQIVELWPKKDSRAIELGQVALLPGLVNAHVHTEFSGLERPLSVEGGFFRWIERVVQWRRRGEKNSGAIQQGLRECYEGGAAGVAEIATEEAAVEQARKTAEALALDLVVFRELYGFQEEQVAERLEVAQRHVLQTTEALSVTPPPTLHTRTVCLNSGSSAVSSSARNADSPSCSNAGTSTASNGTSTASNGTSTASNTNTSVGADIELSGSFLSVPSSEAASRNAVEQLGSSGSSVEPYTQARAPSERQNTNRSCVVYGLSPHAPYTVHPSLFEGLVRLAKQACVPVAMHLAESREEREMLEQGRGPCVELLKRLEVWNDELRRRSISDYLRELAELDRALVVHGNVLNESELRFLAAHQNLTLVYCARTHARFSHGLHPWLRLLELGGRVALGTDSRASNPDLSLWNELRFLAGQYCVEVERLVELGTRAGAQALGLEHRLGTLEPGRPARVLVVPLPDGASFQQLFQCKRPYWLSERLNAQTA